jgi:hypothetical protein
MLTHSSELRDRVWENASYFRKEMLDAGFDIVPEIQQLFLLCYMKHL